MKNVWLFNENKLLILNSLYKCRDDVCGCDLVDKLDIPKNLLSYHIKTLRDKGFIREVKCGNRKHYTVDPKKEKTVKKVLEIVELI